MVTVVLTDPPFTSKIVPSKVNLDSPVMALEPVTVTTSLLVEVAKAAPPETAAQDKHHYHYLL